MPEAMHREMQAMPSPSPTHHRSGVRKEPSGATALLAFPFHDWRAVYRGLIVPVGWFLLPRKADVHVGANICNCSAAATAARASAIKQITIIAAGVPTRTTSDR